MRPGEVLEFADEIVHSGGEVFVEIADHLAGLWSEGFQFIVFEFDLTAQIEGEGAGYNHQQDQDGSH